MGEKHSEEPEQQEQDIRRIKQVFVVGGNGYEHPSDFTRIVNKNLKVLADSDKNVEVLDIDYNIFNDPRYREYGPTFLAFITAEVDVDMTPKVEDDGITRKEPKKRWWRRS